MTEDSDMQLEAPIEQLDAIEDDVEGVGGRGSGGSAGTGGTPGGIGTVAGGDSVVGSAEGTPARDGEDGDA